MLYTESAVTYETMAGTITAPTDHNFDEMGFGWVYCKTRYTNNWDADNNEDGVDSKVIKTIYDPCPAGFSVPRHNTFVECDPNSWVYEEDPDEIFYGLDGWFEWFGVKFYGTGTWVGIVSAGVLHLASSFYIDTGDDHDLQHGGRHCSYSTYNGFTDFHSIFKASLTIFSDIANEAM